MKGPQHQKANKYEIEFSGDGLEVSVLPGKSFLVIRLL